MATERPRFMMSVPEKLFQQIEDFRFENRYQARSDAVNELLRIAFDYLKEQAEDEYLLALAEERERNDNGVRYSFDEILAEHGITREELDNMEDVEIE
jgi:Arc/MetJ-type ribon-helix-helix transcriptional regulator